jgi:hypothetical protein
MARGAIKAPKDTAELGKEIMAPLDRVANLPDPRLSFATPGREQAKARSPRPLVRGAIAVRPIGLDPGQVTWV